MGYLLKDLSNHHKIMIDTAPLIYYIEESPKYLSLVEEIFDKIDNGEIIGITSVITLIEVITKPLKKSNKELESKFRDYLLYSKNLKLYEINVNIAEKAAIYRAKYNLRTPDAIQLVIALVYNADAFLTNDKKFECVKENIKILILENYI